MVCGKKNFQSIPVGPNVIFLDEEMFPTGVQKNAVHEKMMNSLRGSIIVAPLAPPITPIGGVHERGMKGKPAWFKIRLPNAKGHERFRGIKETLRELNLVTVCEEAHCPNMLECWGGGTATFMVMGDTCTRGCKFCAVKKGNPNGKLDLEEPRHLAEAIAKLKLDYAVITSVDRDDLPDQGAAHFAECIREAKKLHPNLLVEVLTPDFRGDLTAVQKIIDAKPDVFAHNVETCPRLQRVARDPRANYEQSLSVLRYVKEKNPAIITKSSAMLGLGETEEEIIQVMKDLLAIGVSIFTLGQYLRPSQRHLAVTEFIPPAQFEKYRNKGEKLGFLFVAAGPFVRSSYRAGELFVKNVLRGRSLRTKHSPLEILCDR